MNFKARWVLHNGGNLWLYRRVLFMWLRYEPFVDRKRKLENKMDKLTDDLEKAFDQYNELIAEETRIKKLIRNHPEGMEHQGPVTIMKLNAFKPARVKHPVGNWEKFLDILRGKGDIASSLCGMTGVQVKGTSFGDEFIIDENDDIQIVAEQSVPVVHRSDNNRSKKNRNQQQNN